MVPLIGFLVLSATAGEVPAEKPAPVPEVAAPADDRDTESSAPNELRPDPDKVGWLQGKLESLEEQYIETKSTVAALSRIKVSGYLQPRYTYLDATAPASTFFLRRGRLKVDYAGTVAGFMLQIDATNAGVALRDAEATLTEPWSKQQLVTVHAGQMKYPFGYEIGQSSSDREFPERTRVVQAFAPGERDRGAKVDFNWRVLRVSAGVFDGNGISNTQFVGKDNDNEKDVIGRVGADFNFVAFGISGWAGKTIKPAEGANAIRAYPRNRIGLDAQLYLDVLPIGGTAIKAELIAGTTYTAGGVERYGQTALGWYALIVQNFLDTYQVGFRYDFFDPATGTPNRADAMDPSKPSSLNQVHTFGFTAAHWFDEVLKLSATFEIPLIWTSGGGDASPKANLFTVQLQARF